MDKSLAAMQEEIRKLVKEGVAEKELDEAKKSYAKNWDSRMATTNSCRLSWRRACFWGAHSRTGATQRQDSEADPGRLNAAAQKFIKPDGLVMVRAGDLAKQK